MSLRFVYAAEVAEAVPAPFIGVETSEGLHLSVGGLAYRLSRGQPGERAHTMAAAVGRWHDKQNESTISIDTLYEPAVATLNVRDAWQFLEAAPRPGVKLAWPVDAADGASVVVPTLNLRVGAVRITRLDEKAKNFVRRLAGIGSSAYAVIDPPASGTRLADAIAIATALQEIVTPPKPVKPKPPAKPAAITKQA